MPPVEAALIGSREISFAVRRHDHDAGRGLRADRLHDRQHRRLFTEFAWTLAGAVIVSGFVALTLSPMMCSQAAAPPASITTCSTASSSACLRRADLGYRALLRGALAVRPLVLLIGLCGRRLELFPVSASSSPSSRRSRTTAPSSASFRAPEGSTIEYTDAYAKQLEEICRSRCPEAERVFRGRRQSHRVARHASFLRLKPWERARRARSRRSPIDSRRSWSPCPGVVAFPSNPPLARAGHPRQAGQVRDPDLAALCRAAGDGRRDAGQGRATIRASSTSTPISSSTRRSSRSPSTATRPRRSASRSRRSAARSRPCSAAARSRASSATASSTT